ncbi:vWA domain-containing protein [Rubritalea marina]|uniref:vWA domain-containing protein n=1 Tax=Rubritalea marina TaxID=361055 RepID=UPI00036C380C|nr:von Willebrand factor type A domain-containing protein [Rubritalea marina]
MDKHKDQNDRLMDELLKEHAKHGTGNDEQFLKELDEKIAGAAVEQPTRKKTWGSPGVRWALGTGIAACVAIGVSVSYRSSQIGDDAVVAFHAEEQLELHRESVAELQEVPHKKASPQALSDLKQSRSVGAMDVPAVELSVDGVALDFNADGFADARNESDVLAGSWAGKKAKIAQCQAEPKPTAEAVGVPRGRVLPHPPHPGGTLGSAEKYGGLTDNPWKAPVDERSSLSTFAVDVDTASYTNIRRMIRDGYNIPADAVRIEEMVNYFDYQYAQPTDKHPFAVHVDAGAAPWNPAHRLVRVGLQAKDIVRSERPAANLVFLLDVSGSMSSDNKLPLLKRSMQYLLEELDADDSVSIVVYAGSSGLALPATKMDDRGRQAVLAKMDSLSAGGSTAGGAGIKLAYKVAQEQFVKGGVNRIILATDGDFNVGVSGTDALTKLVKEKARGGTYLSVLGFGHGNINDAMLESITNNGNGNYHYIDSIKEGRKVLLEDMMGTMVTVAKDVKVQVQMNPSKVKAYRLIGYANRMLPPEAFLDKKVDAGEIGAGHTVTALYEVIPADGKPFKAGVDAGRYFEKVEKQPTAKVKQSPELCHVKLAYKQPEQKMDDESTYLDVPFTDAGASLGSDDHRFASAVALFGMTLRDSEYKGSGDLAMVLDLAKKAQGADGKGQRAEFIELVEKLQQAE